MVKAFLARSGIAALAQALHRRRVAVLMYHGLARDEDPLAEGDWLQVRAGEFAAQMDYLSRRYRVIRFSEALHPPRREDRPRAIITFDDGYASTFHLALPILERFDLPATVFVVTGKLGETEPFWWDRLRLAAWPKPLPLALFARFKALPPWEIDQAVDAYIEAQGWTLPPTPPLYRVLNWEEAGAMARHPLIDLGSHTHRHEILTRLSPQGIIRTLKRSLEVLRTLGADGTLFAAPDGAFRRALIPLLEALGFRINVTTRPGLWAAPSSPYLIPRLDVGQGTDMDAFRVLLSGLP